MQKMTKAFKRFWKEESGQGLAEYGLILALVAVLCIGALKLLQGWVDKSLAGIGEKLGGEAPAAE